MGAIATVSTTTEVTLLSTVGEGYGMAAALALVICLAYYNVADAAGMERTKRILLAVSIALGFVFIGDTLFATLMIL